jgi:membrane associated rhomboid family serine protease
MVSEPSSTAPPVEVCYRHPMRPTGVHCVRCDRPICPECMRPASVGFQCPDDVRLARRTQRAPRTLVGARQSASDRPLLTWGIIGLNVAIYVATAVGSVDGVNQNHTTRLFTDWQLVPWAVATDDEYYRLLTSILLHYGLLHLLLNMIALAMIGPYLERLLGRWRYGAVYLIAGLGGSVAVYGFASRFGPVVGASGAIFGLFAACLLLVRELGLDSRTVIATVVLNFVLTFSVPDISRLGHIGGFVFGGLATVALAGVPGRRGSIVAARTQLLGLGGLVMALVLAVAWRSAVLT